MSVERRARVQMDYSIRKATLEDRPALERLIAESARGLSRADYSEEQIEAAVAAVFGVDTDLILDGTYYVAEADGALAGCGGWSRRRTLFGGDRFAARDPGRLDPAKEPAKIRAFFVHPGWARKGMGGPNASQLAEQAVRQMRAVIGGLTLAHSGGFFSYRGDPVPW